MNQVHFLPLFLILSIANVQARLKAEGIVGGDHAAEGQFGYQVSLSENGISFCGGGIIDDHYVVTAAHCLKFITRRWTRIPFLQVTAGTSDLRSSSGREVIVDVEEVFMPREYDRTSGTGSTTGDIAVLKLKQSLNIDDHPNLRKLKLPSEKQKVDWVKAVVTGFGWNEVYMKFDPNTNTEKENGGRSDGKMRYAHATVMDREMCAKYMAGTAKHLCAAVVQRHAIKHEGICSADSGSPLVYLNTLIGVVSTSPVGCVENNLPAVYTRVSSFVNFIRGAMDGEIDEDLRHLVFITKD